MSLERMLGILIAGGVPPQVAAWACDLLPLYVGRSRSRRLWEQVGDGRPLEEHEADFVAAAARALQLAAARAFPNRRRARRRPHDRRRRRPLRVRHVGVLGGSRPSRPCRRARGCRAGGGLSAADGAAQGNKSSRRRSDVQLVAMTCRPAAATTSPSTTRSATPSTSPACRPAEPTRVHRLGTPTARTGADQRATTSSTSATRCGGSPGLSTELEDITEVEYRQLRLERVVLVGVWTDGTVEDADNSLAELKLLAETAGSVVLDALSQRRQKPDPATYIGPGKVEHLRAGRRRRPAPTR